MLMQVWNIHVASVLTIKLTGSEVIFRFASTVFSKPSFEKMQKETANTMTQLTKFGSVEKDCTNLLRRLFETSDSMIAKITGKGLVIRLRK